VSFDCGGGNKKLKLVKRHWQFYKQEHNLQTLLFVKPTQEAALPNFAIQFSPCMAIIVIYKDKLGKYVLYCYNALPQQLLPQDKMSMILSSLL